VPIKQLAYFSCSELIDDIELPETADFGDLGDFTDEIVSRIMDQPHSGSGK
jgi:hypothetical protein